jgi:Transposase, Mutator family
VIRRGRGSPDRRAAGSGRDVRAAHREETAAAADRGRRDRPVVVRERNDDWGISAHFAEIYGSPVPKKRSPGSLTKSSRRSRDGRDQTRHQTDLQGEIRRVICSTNAIESLNARCWRAVRARGHFPSKRRTEMPVPCDPQPGPDRSRPRPMEDVLEPLLNAFAITSGDRWPAAETY